MLVYFESTLEKQYQKLTRKSIVEEHQSIQRFEVHVL